MLKQKQIQRRVFPDFATLSGGTMQSNEIALDVAGKTLYYYDGVTYEPIGSALESLFADDTTVAPAIAGEPTKTEILTFVGTERNLIVYYTGTDRSTDSETYVFHIDGSGNVTGLLSPMSSLPSASDTVAGIIELSTDAEALTGTATDRALTPANVRSLEADDAAVTAGTANRIITADKVIDEDDLSSDSNARIPTQQSVKAYVDSQVKDRDHADDTTVAPATGGAPTLAEMQTYVTGASVTDTLVYYTGDDLPASTPTHVYQVDGSGVVTEVSSPADAAADYLFADDTTVAPATAGEPTEAEIATFAGAERDRFIHYTGTDTTGDPTLSVFYIDGSGVVKNLGGEEAVYISENLTPTGTNTLPNLVTTVPTGADVYFYIDGVRDYDNQISATGQVVTVAGTFNATYGYDIESSLTVTAVIVSGISGITNTGVTTFEALSDTTIAAAADGDILYYSSGAWVNLAVGTAGQKLVVNTGATAPEWVDDTEGSIVSVTASATIAAGTIMEVVNAATDETVTLPSASTVAEGIIIYVKRLGTGNVTVARDGADTIDESAADYDFDADFALAGSSRGFMSNGADGYYVI